MWNDIFGQEDIRSWDNRGTYDAGPSTFIGEHIAQNEYISVYILSQREKYNDDFCKTRQLKMQI